MHTSIAIASSVVDEEELKRAVLLFDTVVINGLNKSIELTRDIEDSGAIQRMAARMATQYPEGSKEQIALSSVASSSNTNRRPSSDERVRLKERGIIQDQSEFMGKVFKEATGQSEMDELHEWLALAFEKGVRSPSGLMDWDKTDSAGISRQAGEAHSRKIVQRLSTEANIEALPLLAGPDASVSNMFKEGRNAAMHVVLSCIPEPLPYVTGWEEIHEFRSDKDAMGKLALLRNWINEVSRKDLAANEIKDKIEALRYEYEQHMKLHKMKFRAGVLETVVVGTVEFLENMAKLQFGKLAKGLFACHHAKLALMEAELKAPGRELAYLFKIDHTFGQSET